MKCPLRPSRGKLIIKRDEAVEETPGGILLPDQAQQPPVSGEVWEIGQFPIENGQEVDANPMLKPGDQVFFSRYSGTEIEIGDVKWLVLNQTDVLATRRE